MLINKKILVIIFIFISFYLIGEEKRANLELEKYKNQKLSYSFEKQFNEMYPIDIKKFSFKQGDKEISFDEIINLTRDAGLLKNMTLLKKAKIAGFTSAIILGSLTVGFLIPSIVFLAKETNYYLIPDNYALTGIAMVILCGLSFIALIVDFVVTFSLIYKYRYNEKSIKQAIDNYNEKLARKYGIIPDISYFNNSSLFVGARIKI